MARWSPERRISEIREIHIWNQRNTYLKSEKYISEIREIHIWNHGNTYLKSEKYISEIRKIHIWNQRNTYETVVNVIFLPTRFGQIKLSLTSSQMENVELGGRKGVEHWSSWIHCLAQRQIWDASSIILKHKSLGWFHKRAGGPVRCSRT